MFTLCNTSAEEIRSKYLNSMWISLFFYRTQLKQKKKNVWLFICFGSFFPGSGLEKLTNIPDPGKNSLSNRIRIHNTAEMWKSCEGALSNAAHSSVVGLRQEWRASKITVHISDIWKVDSDGWAASKITVHISDIWKVWPAMDELHDPDKRPWISEVLRPAEILAEYQVPRRY